MNNKSTQFGTKGASLVALLSAYADALSEPIKIPELVEIDNLLSLVKDENSENSVIEHSVAQYKSMVPFFLEMKVQVDRWSFCVNKWYLHPNVKDYVLNNMKDRIDKIDKENVRYYLWDNVRYYLWGAEIIFTPFIKEDEILALDNIDTTDKTLNSRKVCLGKLDIQGIQRLSDLKAFW